MILRITIECDGTEECFDDIRDVELEDEVQDIDDILDVVREAVDMAGVSVPEGCRIGLEDSDE